MHFGKAACAMVALLIGSVSTAQAFNAVTTTNVFLRTGPGVSHPAVAVMAANQPVTIFMCTQHHNWCQVSFGGHVGWAARMYLASAPLQQAHVAPVYVQQMPVAVDFPAVVSAPGVPFMQGVPGFGYVGAPVQVLVTGHSASFPGRRVEHRQVVTTYAVPAPVPVYTTMPTAVTYVPLH